MREVTDWILLFFLVIAGIIDLKKKEVPCVLILKMGICIFLFRILWVDVTVSATVGGILIGLFFFFAGKITGEAIGYGDCWMILLLGIYRGGFVVLQIVLVASMASAIFALGYCMYSGWKRKYAIPFVPFLTAAYLGVVIL